MVSFGKPKEHKLCIDHSFCTTTEDHCICNSPWDSENNLCYGDNYLVVYNFFRNLRPIIEKFTPDKCFFALEGHPKFRYDLYPEYKANRLIKLGSELKINPKQDSKDRFNKAKDLIIDLLQFLPITQVIAKDYEADDLIGSLCNLHKDDEVTVITSDSDYIQLLQRKYKNFVLYDAKTKENIIPPEYPYIAWKCLDGDTSDNIPRLMSKAKALKTINDPVLFKKFLELPENLSNFNLNRDLIEFRDISNEQIDYLEGTKDFNLLKEQFDGMKFVSLTADKYWKKFVDIFDKL